MKLTRTVIEVELYDGVKVNATRPSVKELEDMYAQLNDLQDANLARGKWCELLEKHGFTKAQLDELEPDHFVQVVEVMQGTKKKSPTSS